MYNVLHYTVISIFWENDFDFLIEARLYGIIKRFGNGI